MFKKIIISLLLTILTLSAYSVPEEVTNPLIMEGGNVTIDVNTITNFDGNTTGSGISGYGTVNLKTNITSNNNQYGVKADQTNQTLTINGNSKTLQINNNTNGIIGEYPLARDCDQYLYIRVMKILNPDSCNMNFVDVMLNLKELGLPCFETVRRTRAKIQANNPELKPSEKVKNFMEINEEIFREYARS